MVLRYHQERADDEKKAEKEESGRLRRIAGQIAKQVKDFWSNIEKVQWYLVYFNRQLKIRLSVHVMMIYQERVPGLSC